MLKEDLDVLDEINKGACMGIDSILFIIEKVQDKEFKKVLLNQYKEYKKISNKINKLYKIYSDNEPHETNTMNKMMTWYGIEIRTFVNQSSSKVAELLLQGTNMGIIEGRRLLNSKIVNKKTKKLLEEFINMQEKSMEILKNYL